MHPLPSHPKHVELQHESSSYALKNIFLLQYAAVSVSVMRLVVPAIGMRLRAMMSTSIAADVLMGLIEVKAMTCRQAALRWVIAGAEVTVGKSSQ